MSGNFVVMTVEGVLIEGYDLKTDLPSQSGHMLYDTLVQYYAIVLLTQHDRDLVDTWLRKEGIRGFATVLSFASTSWAYSIPAWKAFQVRGFLQAGTAVSWFIDTDPAAIEAVYLEGVPTMMLSNPQFTRPEFRPDAARKVRPWDQLVTTIEMEKLVKMEKEAN